VTAEEKKLVLRWERTWVSPTSLFLFRSEASFFSAIALHTFKKKSLSSFVVFRRKGKKIFPGASAVAGFASPRKCPTLQWLKTLNFAGNEPATPCHAPAMPRPRHATPRRYWN
jgi:hypothetical protein